MSARTSWTTAASAACFVAFTGIALGQTADPPAQGMDLRSTRLPTAAELQQARAHSNRAKVPDTSEAFAETDDGLDVRSVMTDDGLVDDLALVPRAFGSFGIPYTTTRVQEGASSVIAQPANRLSTTFPYRAVGLLNFRIGPNLAHCTATVIRRGVIVTAAHCIQDFGTFNNLFTNLVFRPGHFGGPRSTAQQRAPYGVWRPFRVVRSTSWLNGTDVGCGAARENDLAVLAVRRRASGLFIGDVVGRINYGINNFSFVSSPPTGNLLTAAVTTLGYPGLIDQGRIMQRTDGPSYTATLCGAPVLLQGSNFTGGSSGGPWIVNFSGRNGTGSGGALRGAESAMAIVGATSFGAVDPNVSKNNFSSQFAQNSQFPDPDYGGYGPGNIGGLLATLCQSPAPEGGTLEAQGYCD